MSNWRTNVLKPHSKKGRYDGLQAMSTPAQVAAFMSTSPDAIRRLIRLQKLPAVRMGRKLYVPRDALIDFLERGCHV